MRFFLTILILLAVPAPSFAQCDSGEKVIRFGYAAGLKFAARDRAAKLFANVVNKELQGRACVNLLDEKKQFSGTLAVTAVQNGEAEMAAPSFETLGGFASAFRVFDLPFAFRDMRSLERFQNSVGSDLGDTLTRNGIQAVAFWHEGFLQVSARKAIVVPGNAAGLRFRADGGRFSAEMISRLNSTSQTVTDTELAAVLKSGRVTAQLAAWDRLQANKTAEGSAGVSELNLRFQGYQLIASKTWWDGIDSDLKRPLIELIGRVSKQANFDAAQRQTNAKRALMRSNIVVRALTRKQRELWLVAVKNIWRDFSQAGNAGLVLAIEKANTGL